MEKDNTYWKTHKIVFNEMVQDMDSEIVRRVYNNPNCQEAHLLEKRVETETEKRILLPQV